MSTFVAVDVETANPNMDSICQIGLVKFEDGRETLSESWLINPNTWFDPINVSIHGIDHHHVKDAPRFCDVYANLFNILSGQIVVSHTHFDRVAIHRASEKISTPLLECSWVDSARVARRTWESFSQRGYGLANLAQHFGFVFEHHNANDDARISGRIMLKAIEASGVSVSDWVVKASRPLSFSGASSLRRTGDGDGALVGEVIVFTGSLTIPRKLAADQAAEAGGDVHPSVTKATTILVVGDQDISRLSGHTKSSKHRRAKELIAMGQPIRIIGESDFLALSQIKG